MIRRIGIAKYVFNILLITSFLLSMSWVHAGMPKNSAIQGYSPVSYFEKDKAEMDLAECSVEFEGKLYKYRLSDKFFAALKICRSYGRYELWS